MKGGEGYDKFLKNIKKKLFQSRFDRASPEKKKVSHQMKQSI